MKISEGLDADIRLTHERFLMAMDGRLAEMAMETKERYFAVLSLLVSKLEHPDKSLREVLREIMSEAANLVFTELGAPR